MSNENKLKEVASKYVGPRVNKAFDMVSENLEKLFDDMEPDDTLSYGEKTALAGEYLVQMIYRLAKTTMLTFTVTFDGKVDMEIATAITTAMTDAVKEAIGSREKYIKLDEILNKEEN